MRSAVLGGLLTLIVSVAAAQEESAEENDPGFWQKLKDRTYVSGIVEIEGALGTASGDVQKFETQVQPKIEIELPKELDLTIIPRLRFDLVDKIEPGQPEQDEIGHASRRLFIGDRIDLELREFYVEATAGDTYLTIGKQQVVWGKADGLKVIDVINPQDFREFVLDDFDDSRIPLWTFNAEIPIKEVTLQLLWLPDLTYHKIPESGALYEFVSNVPQAPPGFGPVQRPIDRPDNAFLDSDVGARLSAFWGGWDLTLNYFYHYDDIPVLYRTVTGGLGGPLVTVSPSYERTHLIGGTFSNAFGDLTLRGEMGYSTDKFYSTTSPTDADGVHETGEFGYVLGFDWFGISETLLSFQFFQTILTDDAAGLLRDQVENNISFLAQRDFMNDTLVASIIWVHNINDGDGFVRPKVEYDMRDNVTLWTGFDLFYGTGNGLFGQFGKTDRFVTGVEIGF